MRKSILLFAVVAAVSLMSVRALALSGNGEPPPDPSPPEPKSIVGARAQNEVVLRSIELEDLLARDAGNPPRCNGACLKVTDPSAIQEFVGNTCHVLRSLGFETNYANQAKPDVARLATVSREACTSFEASVRTLGDLNDSQLWKQQDSDSSVG